MKNLIVAICGDESLHKTWVEGNPEFDLCIFYYGDNKEKYKNEATLYDQAKGTKFVILDQMAKKYADFFDKYDAILVPDDDLYITTEDWNRFFKIFHAYQMKLAQPSILGWQCVFTSCPNANYILRYTNWVEIMTPCFNQETFQKLKKTFAENKTNWGIDFLWIKLLESPKTGVGIIDDVVAIHTRPCFYGDTYWRNKNSCDDAIKEITDLRVKYDIQEEICVYGGVERDRYAYDQNGSEDKFMPGNCKVLKELINSLRRKKVGKFI